MKAGIGTNTRSKTARSHAKRWNTTGEVHNALANSTSNGRTLQTDWTYLARWVKIKYVQHVAKVEARCLHVKLYSVVWERKRLNGLLTDN